MFYNENLSENDLLCFCIDPILGKILFLRYRSKCFCQSDCRIFKSTISPEQIDESTSLFACWYKFTKIKSWLEFFWLSRVKNGCGQSGLWTLKLTISKEWTNGINFFLQAGTNSGKLKVDLMIFGWAQTKMVIAF